mmetsp:Transcript_28904/g.48107  ORF Transcript_28904/g.48107 Transcript_28904/m.48107 type:complete len:137 (+) Transcript_28904:512-922(+)
MIATGLHVCKIIFPQKKQQSCAKIDMYLLLEQKPMQCTNGINLLLEQCLWLPSHCMRDIQHNPKNVEATDMPFPLIDALESMSAISSDPSLPSKDRIICVSLTLLKVALVVLVKAARTGAISTVHRSSNKICCVRS